MRKQLCLAAALAAAAIATVLGAGPATAGTGAQHRHCLLPAEGEQAVCASSAAELKAMAPTAEVPVLTIHSAFDFLGYTWTYYREPCTPEVGGDADYVITIGPTLYEEVSSVTKHAGGHCDWRLVDAGGIWSQSVESSWANLTTLGTNWNNRAVKIRLD